MKLQLLSYDFVVCRLNDAENVDRNRPLTFFAKTDMETSYVCPVSDVPDDVQAREDGWRGMRVSGVLEFSLIGILAKISGVLAAKEISIFVISTFDTDYIFVKKDQLSKAVAALEEDGWEIESLNDNSFA